MAGAAGCWSRSLLSAPVPWLVSSAVSWPWLADTGPDCDHWGCCWSQARAMPALDTGPLSRHREHTSDYPWPQVNKWNLLSNMWLWDIYQVSRNPELQNWQWKSVQRRIKMGKFNCGFEKSYLLLSMLVQRLYLESTCSLILKINKGHQQDLGQHYFQYHLFMSKWHLCVLNCFIWRVLKLRSWNSTQSYSMNPSHTMLVVIEGLFNI